ncbi:hypothetical protein [Caenimonas koreensis]|uniref:Uncharacterized protein n=1 Tax=Caenimonas koreensis DSM 17982 TaxID=1121255 RepID=A0A844AYW0_9BURK|nr:hypothetical protein [Caenimonas koreensis]MRD47598.1 hypothetical protein [Caenimonas koreensis DSM 17982]
MAVFRWAVLVLLVASAICFLIFAVTGQPRYKAVGLKLLFTTLAAGFVFFAVLIAENLLE